MALPLSAAAEAENTIAQQGFPAQWQRLEIQSRPFGLFPARVLTVPRSRLLRWLRVRKHQERLRKTIPLKSWFAN